MMLSTTIKNIHKQGTIILYPLLFDLISFLFALAIIGFHGKPFFSIKLILEMGFPSVSHISNIPVFMHDLALLNELNSPALTVIILAIFFLFMRVLFQGGYIGFLASISKNERFAVRQFFTIGRKKFVQLLLLEIIVYLLKIGLAAFFVIFFPGIGGITALFALVAVRVVFIFIEFTLVEESVNIPKALTRSKNYYFRQFMPTSSIVILMYAVTIGLSYLLHMFWSLPLVIVMIVIYSYVMTIIQSLLMNLYQKANY